MVQCERCGRSTPAPVKVVTQTRARKYPPRPRANLYRHRFRGRNLWVTSDDPGGVGWEIAHEGLFCPECAGEIRARPWVKNPSEPSVDSGLSPRAARKWGKKKDLVLYYALHPEALTPEVMSSERGFLWTNISRPDLNTLRGEAD